MSNNTSLDEIKSKIDIISLAESYGFEFEKPRGIRYRARANLLRDEKTSSIDFFADSQKYYDRGAGTGGDCIDLIQHMENISQAEAINKAKSMAGADVYEVTKRTPVQTQVKKEVKEFDFNKLAYIAKKELSASDKFAPRVVETATQDKQGTTLQTKQEIYIHSEYIKLFESSKFDIEYKAKLDYLFRNILGYSEFWKSPTIILRDSKNKIVDMVAYRPKSKDTGEEIPNMKYYCKNQNNRGDDFIYPFEILVKAIVSKMPKEKKYIVVGEGLKNGLNALIYSIPFISVESTGNSKRIDKKLIESIDSFIKDGCGLITAFDGDKAGKEAYEAFISFTGYDTENLFDFDSGIDFVEYMQGSEDE